MITYNQKEFIGEAIESVLEQKTNFNYKLIIGEDNSTDGTREIVRDYEKKYSNKILVLYHDENLGPNENAYQVLKNCTAKYVAILEGDDKWTDSHKLQKQVDFLETHHDFVMCSHAVKTVFDGVDEKDPFVKPLKVATFEDIVTHGHFIPTLSIVFRRDALPEIPVWFKDMLAGDIPLNLLITHYGKNYYIDEVMGLKRKHKRGVSQKSRIKALKIKVCFTKNKLYFYEKLNEFFNYEHKKVLNPIISHHHLYVMNMDFKNGKYAESIVHLIKSFYYSPMVFLRTFINNKWLKK